jgi:hypothetical protein
LPSFISSCGFGGILNMRSAICRVASSNSGFLTMTDLEEIEITKAEIEKATREFNEVYGAALAEWSRLEGQLFYWFNVLTGMDEKTARGVFFSARNFNARADMLEAALDATRPGGPVQALLRTALKKARGYSGFRNSATHGEPHINAQCGSPTAKQLVIIQGRKMSDQAESTMITMLDLMTATNNFRRLNGLLFAARQEDGPKPASLLETYRQQVHELPNQPHSTEPNRNPLKPPHPL